MKQILIAVLVMMTIGCSDENEMNLNDEPFVGNWVTIDVFKDGVLQTEWSNTNLMIRQENEVGGTYQMVNSPYDSIWSSNGSWNILNSYFVLDNDVTVGYSVENDTLHLTKNLPWTSIPCEPEEEPCILVITGQWDFRFKKSE